MKFEKINDNKIKITLSFNELSDINSLDELMANSNNAQDVFFNILDKANKAIGFDTKDYKIKIDAKAMYNGDFIFVITKLMKLKVKNNVVKPKKIIKSTQDDSVYSIYKFNTFDDFSDFCTHLKKNKVNYINRLAKECLLFKLDSSFFLSLKYINNSYYKLATFYSTITEFSKYYSSSNLFVSSLNEHGTLYLPNNAIINCQKYLI